MEAEKEEGETHYGRHQLRNARQHPARGATRVFSYVRTALFRGYEPSYRESRRQTFCHVRAMKTSRDFPPSPPSFSLSLSLLLIVVGKSTWMRENRDSDPRFHVLFMLIVRLCFFFCAFPSPRLAARKFDVRERKNR